MSDNGNELKNGRVVGVYGPVVDVEFPPDALPEINTALFLTRVVGESGETEQVTAEVAQQIGEGRVRAIALRPSDGLSRGSEVVNTGRPITVPVG
ncbi:MAG: F0F1 ATP synthase subunit beta, partial [Actinobacteria bacterium ATB1]|nr:F0F1 ATP synthase subunit beta [Actinobacteria bacterium ATB1]